MKQTKIITWMEYYYIFHDLLSLYPSFYVCRTDRNFVIKIANFVQMHAHNYYKMIQKYKIGEMSRWRGDMSVGKHTD